MAAPQPRGGRHAGDRPRESPFHGALPVGGPAGAAVRGGHARPAPRRRSCPSISGARAPGGSAAGTAARWCGSRGGIPPSSPTGSWRTGSWTSPRRGARLDGEYLAALGELAARDGAQGAAHRLRDITRMTAMAARGDARLALDLHDNDYSDTLEAMRAGEVNLSHARVIAREAPKKHRRSETEFLELCRAYPADTVAKHPFAYQSEEMYADLAAEQAAKSREPADAEYAVQRAERKTTLNCGADGMWHLRGRFDFLTGRRINQALAAAIRARTQHEASADHTHAQHAADALAELVCGETRTDTRLLILADYDHTADTLRQPPPRRRHPPIRRTPRPTSPRRRGLLRRLQRRLDQPRPRTQPQRQQTRNASSSPPETKAAPTAPPTPNTPTPTTPPPTPPAAKPPSRTSNSSAHPATPTTTATTARTPTTTTEPATPNTPTPASSPPPGPPTGPPGTIPGRPPPTPPPTHPPPAAPEPGRGSHDASPPARAPTHPSPAAPQPPTRHDDPPSRPPGDPPPPPAAPEPPTRHEDLLCV